METTLQVHSDLSLTAKIGPCEKWRLGEQVNLAQIREVKIHVPNHRVTPMLRILQLRAGWC